MNAPASHIFNIPPQYAFVDALAHGLWNSYGHDALLFSRVLVLLPSRRACRALREAFLRITAGKPLLLPRIQPIGDVDEDELLLAGWLAMPDASQGTATNVRRQLLLGRLIGAFNAQRTGETQPLDQSVWLAAELMRFLDEAERQHVPLDGLHRLVPAEYAEHWKEVVEFLSVLSQNWEGIEREQGVESPVKTRNRLMQALVEQWRDHPPQTPVIAAGSTGSIPATAQLLKAVAQLPQGLLVLPGLDTAMPDAVWDLLEETHPQFGLRQLLGQLKCERQDVVAWHADTLPSANAARAALLAQAMLPPAATEGWHALQIDWQQALDRLRYQECASPQEEAKVIALLLREALETPGKTAALVTADRTLARRVCAVMERFGVALDDSAGKPLANTPPAVFLKLVLEAVTSHMAPVALLAMLKHPLCSIGGDRETCLEMTRLMELAVMRGERIEGGMEGLIVAVKLRVFDKSLAQRLIAWLRELQAAFATFAAANASAVLPLAALVDAHIACAENLSMRPEGGALWQGQGAQELAQLIADIRDAAEVVQTLAPPHYSGLLEALLAGNEVRARFGTHPRLHILSPMEARLQHYDRVILAGLNEGGWPALPSADPWMSRPMRTQFGLPLNDRAVGQSAHDFCQLFHAPEVFLTRAAKQEGTPTVPSRWIQRLKAILDAHGQWASLAGDAQWTRWAHLLDAPEAMAEAVRQPAPVPPVSSRPRALYATRVELLLRDPYSIYARFILSLEPLEALDKEPDAALLGSMIHEAMECFCKKHPQTLPDNPVDALLACGMEAFAVLKNKPVQHAFWWARFENAAHWIIEQERIRRPGISEVLAEKKGEYAFEAPGGTFTLKAKADRIERRSDGSLVIADYKTGSKPKGDDIVLGHGSQLPLIGVIAEHGEYEGVEESMLQSLEYWEIKGTREKGRISTPDSKKLSLEALLGDTREGLLRVIAQFDNVQTPYVSHPHESKKPKYSDYDQLARVDEWAE